MEVVPSLFVEDLDKSSFPEPWRYAEETALGKAREVATRLQVGTASLAHTSSLHTVWLTAGEGGLGSSSWS